MSLTDKQKLILGGSVLFLSVAVMVQSGKKPTINPTKIVYPPANGGTSTNRIYNIIRDPAELDPLVITRLPLLLNFVRLGEPASNKLTEALHEVVGRQMPKENKAVSMVSIELDNPENLPLQARYAVNDVPSVVALKKQLIDGRYVDAELNSDPVKNDVKMDELTQWVREHAEDIKNGPPLGLEKKE